MKLTSTLVEGTTVKIGDVVGFKADVEQYGKITKITKEAFGGVQLTLQASDRFEGGYIGGQTVTTQPADRCWVD